MTLSERIRKAALGPTPVGPSCSVGWLPDSIWDFIDRRYRMHILDAITFATNNTQRRLFLLFVAEALESR